LIFNVIKFVSSVDRLASMGITVVKKIKARVELKEDVDLIHSNGPVMK
jgi:hypothetical protein